MTNLGSPVVVLSGSGQPVNTFPPEVQIFSGLSISRLAAVIASAGMLVSNDTGPMHLGPAFGVPTHWDFQCWHSYSTFDPQALRIVSCREIRLKRLESMR